MLYAEETLAIAKFVKCPDPCPDGEPCCLNHTVEHVLHMCKDPGCPCHSQHRYEREKLLRSET